jgi:uncharacterized repeat protein (TIGR03803 family)
MKLPNAAGYSLSICTAVIMLAACSSTPSITPMQGRPAQDPNRVSRFVTPGMRPTRSYKTLYRFAGPPGDGSYPSGALINVQSVLYGTTASGGSACPNYGCGTVYRVSKSGVEKVLYSFTNSPDGNAPVAPLTHVNGVFYGTTVYGGSGCSNGCGTVYRVNRNGVEKVLYRFKGSPDGEAPGAGLIDVNGTLYGTTSKGGSSDNGTVFSISTTGAEKVLYSFANLPDGAYPSAGLIEVHGELYGTTTFGGSSTCGVTSAPGCGIVFRISTAGSEDVLYRFEGNTDGAFPEAGLTDLNGTLYGTTDDNGGYFVGFGVVFSITTSGAEKVLYQFLGGQDGANPDTSLIAVKGKLYGTTDYGGCSSSPSCGVGTIYEVSTTGVERALHRFGYDYAATPSSALTNLKGTLYGTTGGYYNGTVFTLSR